MNTKEKFDLAHWAAGQVKKFGADDAAVNLSNSRSIEVEVRNGKVDILKESTENSMTVAVYAKNRFTSHTTNDIRKDALTPFIEEAVNMTKYLGEDIYRTLPDEKYYPETAAMDLGTADDTYDDLKSEKRVKIAREIEDAALAHSNKIISCTAYFSDSESEVVKVNTKGFEGTRRGTTFGCGAEATVDDNGVGRPEDYEWITVRFQKDLPNFAKLGIGAVDRALAKIGQKKIDSGKYEMLVENRTAARLLYGLQGPMSGRSLQQKSSFLDGKLGQKIFSDKLTIVDDPFIKGGMGSRHFDGDGMACRKRTLIDRGVLKEFLIDWYYSRKLGVDPTGGSTTNVTFALGDKSLDEMIANTERGILVTSFIGGNSNSTTGDFSYGIIGKLIENGKVVTPVNEMNISGNMTEFWSNLIETGNDPYLYSSMRRPSLRFKDVNFSGV